MLATRILIIAGSIFSLLSSLRKQPYEAHLQPLLDEPAYSYHHAGFPTAVEEQRTPVALAVIGHIPSWLQGELVQNGPGKFTLGNQQLRHWFDGFAFLTSLKFAPGKVYYQSALLQSDPLQESLQAHQLRLLSFGQPLPKPQVYYRSHDKQKVQSANASINIQKLGKHFIALGENPLPIEFDLSTLNTVGHFDFPDKLKKIDAWESAHMKQDPSDSTIYNFKIDYGFQSAYILYKIAPGQTKRTILKRHKINEPSYMHDFSITQNHIIFTAYPLVVNPRDINDPRYSFIGAHRWEPERQTKVYIFEKKTGNLVALLDAPPMFAFHHVNAFENTHGAIDLYLNACTDASIIARINTFEKTIPQSLQKMTINLKESSVSMQLLSEEVYDLPTINTHFLGQPNHYFYAVCYRSKHIPTGFGLVKYNLLTNQVNYWSSSHVFCGEPLFVSKPGAITEDDGVLLTIAYDAAQNKSFLLILDAKTLQALAKAYLPHPLPMRLHSQFFAVD